MQISELVRYQKAKRCDNKQHVLFISTKGSLPLGQLDTSISNVSIVNILDYHVETQNMVTFLFIIMVDDKASY